MSAAPYRLARRISGQLCTGATALTLEEMVQTTVPRYLELWPDAHSRAALFGDNDALNDAFHVPLRAFASPQKKGKTDTHT